MAAGENLPDYYKILGVPHDASQEEIRRVWRTRAKEFHPDVSSHPRANDIFIELNEAYQTLSDPERRKEYDRFGSAGMTTGVGHSHSPASGSRGGHYGWTSWFTRRPESHFSSRTSNPGAQSDFWTEIYDWINRPTKPGVITCPACRGKGVRRSVHVDISLPTFEPQSFIQEETCFRCNGKGEIPLSGC